jgi:type IV pilus assembly protein PilC
MEVRRALAAGLRTARSVVYTAEIPAITERIEQRQTIHESLAASNVFPKQLLDMIDVGEQSGQLPETLLRMSDEYQERARANLKTWATVGGFLVWAFVALVIGAIIVNIMRTYVGAINRAATP